MWKKLVAVLALLVVGLGLAGFWLASLLEDDSARQALRETRPGDLDYLQQKPDQTRGKILAVVTNVDSLGPNGKYTGYELTELARAYYVFETNGFKVDIASPLGGEPPAVIDGDDMGRYDYAFLNDKIAQHKIKHSLPLDTVNSNEYSAVFLSAARAPCLIFRTTRLFKPWCAITINRARSLALSATDPRPSPTSPLMTVNHSLPVS